MKKLHLMHVITDTNIGGAGTLLCNLLRCLDNNRFTVTVVIPEKSELIHRLAPLPCQLVRTKHGADTSADYRAIHEYCHILQQYKPDILHTHASLAARIAGRLCHIPVCVQTRHCVFPLAVWQKNPLFRWAFRQGSQWLSDGVLAVAEAAKENLLELGMEPSQIRVIVNGVLPIRPTSPDEQRNLARRLGIKPEHYVIGMVARLEDYKGHMTVLHAVARLAPHFPNLRILMIGEGSLHASIVETAQLLGISPHIILTGFVSDPAPYYALMQWNLNASYGTETSSLALSEGMSAGVPALASTFGGNPRMIIDGENGFLFPPKDEKALSNLIEQVYRSPTLRQKMSEGALRHYRERLTAQAMARQMEGWYEELWEAKTHLLPSAKEKQSPRPV